VSITNLSRLGSVLVTLLLLAVAGFAYNHTRDTSSLMETNASVETAARDASKWLDGLIADSAYQFLQFVNRDRISGDEVVDLLNRLVAIERSLSVHFLSAGPDAPLRQRNAFNARTAFYNFLDEEAADPASDTTIALKAHVTRSLANLRNELSQLAQLISGGDASRADFQLLRDLFASSERQISVSIKSVSPNL